MTVDKITRCLMLMDRLLGEKSSGPLRATAGRSSLSRTKHLYANRLDDRHPLLSLRLQAPNAGAHLLPEARATQERRLEAVRFRVKAPVPRRPPHRSGREGFPPPV